MKRLLSVLAPATLLALGACATPFQANVSRYSQLPAPRGQTFEIRADNPRLDGSLEFATYAERVASHLAQVGYVRAGPGAPADLIVTLDYGVDRGREKVRTVPGTGFGAWGPYPYGLGPWGHPYWGYGRRAFVYGFYDPFWFDQGEVQSYTVYTSELDLKIDRAADRLRLFEGRAQAQSTDNDLTGIVPNLIEAMFTNFPGNNGQTVKITVAPERKQR